MSYTVLARKWRPATFEELVGQSHVQRALINAIEQNRLHHAYLFTGTRGVGKTTIARIFSKCLNCETGITAKPCGECAVCQEIDQGHFVDLIEVDAASRTKVEDTREILDNVQYRPTRGRYKVYLIDEVHMLSNSSFNALLKTLEEPPPHVVFLLATTDPQKLPITVLSRCLQFHLKRMTPPTIAGHLEHILNQEKISFEPASLPLVAQAADGSMRDALSLLDQAIAFGAGKLNEQDVAEMLGAIDQTFVIEFLAGFAEKNAVSLLDVTERMSEFAPDYQQVLADIISALHRIAVLQLVGEQPGAELGTESKLIEYAEKFTQQDIQLYYQLAITARKDLGLAPDPRQGFEMALLRMLAFQPATSGALASQTHSQQMAHQNNPNQGLHTQQKKKPELTSEVDARRTQQPKEAISHDIAERPSSDLELKRSIVDMSAVNPQNSQRETEQALQNEALLNAFAASEPSAASNQVGNTEFDNQLDESSHQLNSNRDKVSPNVPPKISVKISPSEEFKTSRPDEPDAHSLSVALDEQQLSNVIVKERPQSNWIDDNRIDEPLITDTRGQKATLQNSAPSEPSGNENGLFDAMSNVTSELLNTVSQSSKELEPGNSRTDVMKETFSKGNLSKGNLSKDALNEPRTREKAFAESKDESLTTDKIDFTDFSLSDLLDNDQWYQFISHLGLTGRIFQVVNNSCVERVDGNKLTLKLLPSVEHFCSESTLGSIKEALNSVLSKKISVSVELGDDNMMTPRVISEQRHQQHLQDKLNDYKANPKVASILSTFSADLTVESIKLH